MFFEKRPEIIEATQWTGNTLRSIQKMIGDFVPEFAGRSLLLTTRSDVKKLDIGQWLILDQSEIKIMNDSEFKKKYKKIK